MFVWGFVCVLFFFFPLVFFFFPPCSMISWNVWTGRRSGVWWRRHGSAGASRPWCRTRQCLFSTWMWACGTWPFTTMARTKKWSPSVQSFWTQCKTAHVTAMGMASVYQGSATVFQDFMEQIVLKLPARFCAVAMVSTPRAPACATVAGKVQNVTYPSASALTPHVEVMVPASKGTVSVLWAIKEKTVREVGHLFSVL